MLTKQTNTIKSQQNDFIKMIKKIAKDDYNESTFAGHPVRVAAVIHGYGIGVAKQLAKHTGFGLAYHIQTKEITYYIASTKASGIDCSKISESYNGIGTKNLAKFSLPNEIEKTFVV